MVERGQAFGSWRRAKLGRDKPAPRDCVQLERSLEAYMLSDEAEGSLLDLSKRALLTARGIKRLCRIARTIADIDEMERVSSVHILEAAMYRGRVHE